MRVSHVEHTSYWCRLCLAEWANMTSCTKPEVHNVLHCCQRRTEPRPQVTRAENFVKFGRVVFEICERTDRHTDTLIAILRTPIYRVKVTRFGCLEYTTSGLHL